LAEWSLLRMLLAWGHGLARASLRLEEPLLASVGLSSPQRVARQTKSLITTMGLLPLDYGEFFFTGQTNTRKADL
jgi:hypothetical protein